MRPKIAHSPPLPHAKPASSGPHGREQSLWRGSTAYKGRSVNRHIINDFADVKTKLRNGHAFLVHPSRSPKKRSPGQCWFSAPERRRVAGVFARFQARVVDVDGFDMS